MTDTYKELKRRLSIYQGMKIDERVRSALNEALETIEKLQAVEKGAGEPVGFMFEDDFKKLSTTECCTDIYSVEAGHPDKGQTTVKLYALPQSAVTPDNFFDPWVLFDPETNAIKMDPDTKALAIFDTESAAKAMKRRHPGTEHKQVRYIRPPKQE